MTKMIADTAICVLGLLQVMFTAQYLLRSPWWRTELGQIYAAKSVVWSLVIAQVCLSVITSSDYPGRHGFRIAIYIGGAIAMVCLYVVLVRIQRQGREERAAIGDTRSQWQIWMDTLKDWAGR